MTLKSGWREPRDGVRYLDICAGQRVQDPLRAGIPVISVDPARTNAGQALAEVVIGLDHADDSDIKVEAGMRLLELSDQDWQALADLINQSAWRETDPDRHLTAWEAPATLGLLSD